MSEKWDLYSEGNKNKIVIQVEQDDLDKAIEKATRLKELLREVHELIRAMNSTDKPTRDEIKGSVK